MQHKISTDEIRHRKIYFWSSSAGALTLAVLIHLLAPGFMDRAFTRMMLVIMFFGALATATWSLSQPFRDYNNARMRWQFADAPPGVRQNVERYLIRTNRVAARLSIVSTLGVISIALAVLSHWDMFRAIAGFRTLFYWGGFGCLVLTPVVLVASAGELREARAMRRQMDEEMQISGSRMRDARTATEDISFRAQQAVEVIAPMKFRAGEYDWNVSDFYKSAAIFGQPGSGKTICVLNALLDGLLQATGAAGQPASALILDPKGDFHDKIGTLASNHGRKNDLLIIDPAEPRKSICWNPLDSDDDAQEIAGRFGAVMEILNPSGKNDTFWIDSAKRLVENLISLLRYARPDAPPSLIEIYEAALSDEVIEGWGRMISDDTYDASHEVERTFRYFFDVWLPMPSDMRGTIRSFVSNMLGSFLRAPYDTLFAGRSTVRMGEVLDQGKILYVNMPIADKEVMARVVSTFIKLEFYREVLKRRRKPRPSFFLCDEFQSFFTVGQGRGDADAFERTRESNHANIIAFQNLNALFKQTERREPVLNLLGNCAIKIFLRNTEKETNEYASELFGQYIETLSGSSVSIGQGLKQSTSGSSISGSAQYAARIKKDEFTALEVPSVDDNSPYAQAIAHLAARAQVQTRRMRWKVHPIGKP